ncbi:uncharacterized protein LOC101448569 isoform X2 [Ceratitis capitata]|uniref:uncharacterized protein LOC101448569 isoform X2 n=1 Tax=Ceratitis capitata TaxID=7213 RepID=UPI000618904B|nr:uncharacterized protein LOC101448569 isoform X2 [Ceratitis capitata]
MKILKVMRLYIICYLELTYFALLLKPVKNAVTGNITNVAYQCRLWPTNVSYDIKSNTIITTTTTGITHNVCITLYITHNYRRIFNCDQRNIEIYKSNGDNNNTFNELLKDNKNSKNCINYERSWDRYLEQKTPTTYISVTKIQLQNIRRYYKNIFEITLCMLFAIVMDTIPITIYNVRKRILFYWGKFQIFYSVLPWTFAIILYQRRHILCSRHYSAVNCLYDIVKFVTTILKQMAGQSSQKQQYSIRKQLTIFAAITGRIFSFSIEGTPNPITDVAMPDNAECAYSKNGICLFLSDPSTVLATSILVQSCQRSCQHFLLLRFFIDLANRKLYLLMSKERRLFRKHLILPALILHELNFVDVRSESKYSFGITGVVEIATGNILAHQKFQKAVITQLRSNQPNTFFENNYNIYVETFENNTCTFKITKLQNEHEHRAEVILNYKLDINVRIYETLLLKFFLEMQHKYITYFLVQQLSKHRQRRTNLMSVKSKSHFVISRKLKKHVKALSRIYLLTRSSNIALSVLKRPNIIGESIDWKYYLHTFIKLEFCGCSWCLYFYRYCTALLGRNLRVCTYFCCRQWCWRQKAHNLSHCIFCYSYFRCFCCFYCCYCCCCCRVHIYPISKTSLRKNFNKNRAFNNCVFVSQKYWERVNTSTIRKRRLNARENNKMAKLLRCYRRFIQSHHLVKVKYNTHHCCLHSTSTTAAVPTATYTKRKQNTEAKHMKTMNLINFIQICVLHIGKGIFDQFINLADYICRFTTNLRLKTSVPGSASIAIKVTREQQQQQQQHQQQMINIAHDQQLKMNYLCKIFCNNWKRHHRRRRRRRRRRMNKQEQALQSVQPKQQEHINSEIENRLVSPRLHILDLKACKTISTNLPHLHFALLSKASNVFILAAMRLTNTKIVQLTNAKRKDILSSPQGSNLISTPTTTSTLRINRNRTRPHLVWLFIGLVWFEGPKYINCTLHENRQSQQTTTQVQVQAQSATRSTTQIPLQSLSTLTVVSQNQQRRQQHMTPPTQISTDLFLLAPNAKQTKRGQKVPTATTFKYKKKQRKNSNVNGKSIRSGNCLPARRNAVTSIMTTTRNDKKSQSENDELNSSVGRERSDCFDTHTIEAETELLDEEAHNVQNDHIRLESIKRQILTKLGLKHKPNVSQTLPRQFIWDTIYRADGIKGVASDFDFNENGSHQWKIISKITDTKETEKTHTHNTKGSSMAWLPLIIKGWNAGKQHNREYKAYLQNVLLAKSNNFTYLMRINTSNLNKDFREVEESESIDRTYDNRDGLYVIGKDQNYQINHNRNKDATTAKSHKYSSHQLDFVMSSDQRPNENDDFFGDTQEIITFAEKGNGQPNRITDPNPKRTCRSPKDERNNSRNSAKNHRANTLPGSHTPSKLKSAKGLPNKQERFLLI